jgi:hypothetical protein
MVVTGEINTIPLAKGRRPSPDINTDIIDLSHHHPHQLALGMIQLVM